jgi:agmatine deiminase
MTTPREDGFRVPIRSCPHERTLMAWPVRDDLFGGHEERARAEWAAVARTIARFEPVTMIVTRGAATVARDHCGPGIELLELPIDDGWIRDSGPIGVVDGSGGVAMTRFGFNAWGAKYSYDDDAEIAGRVAERLGYRTYRAPLIAEGGGIATDGEGTIITTESVVLNPNRNPGTSKEAAEAVFREYLGAEKVIWLPHGLAEDMGELGTDGHSDNIVQFVRPGVVLLQAVPERANPNWDLMRVNRSILEGMTDAAGRTLEIVEMPYLPYTEPIDGERLAAPYTNFYPVNGGIIAPRVDEATDDEAHALLGELYPGREVAAVPTLLQAYGGGGVGCVTQQVPAGPPAR